MMTRVIVITLAFTVLGGTLALAQSSKPEAPRSLEPDQMHCDLKRLTPFASTENGGSQSGRLVGVRTRGRCVLAGCGGERCVLEEDAVWAAALASHAAEADTADADTAD